MPVIMKIAGFRFFFFSNEGTPLKPEHIHVMKAGAEAKFWLIPKIALAKNRGFDLVKLIRIKALITQHHATLLEAWHDYFHSKGPL